MERPAPAGVDVASLRLYRLALASEARRFRHYPEAAKRAGLTGTAEVRVASGLGAVRPPELVRSSGHALLDAAALEMVSAAAQRVAVPEGLRGHDFSVVLPVVFNVREAAE